VIFCKDQGVAFFRVARADGQFFRADSTLIAGGFRSIRRAVGWPAPTAGGGPVALGFFHSGAPRFLRNPEMLLHRHPRNPCGAATVVSRHNLYLTRRRGRTAEVNRTTAEGPRRRGRSDVDSITISAWFALN